MIGFPVYSCLDVDLRWLDRAWPIILLVVDLSFVTLTYGRRGLTMIVHIKLFTFENIFLLHKI